MFFSYSQYECPTVHFAKKNYSPDQATVEDAGTVIKVVVLCDKCAAVKSLIIRE